MGHSRPLSSKPSKLSESCNRRLNAYALAASAAGLGLFTLAPRAGAKIVYTPANLPLMNQQQVFFDLNHDGINDFSFYGRSTSRRSISTFFFRLTVFASSAGKRDLGSRESRACFLRGCSAPWHSGRT
jgi:hypothetical protein